MIRKITVKDKENWKKLYKGYADFYKSPINLAALAHYRAMPRPLRG